MDVNSEGLPMSREITITRIFDAPRELVYQAWTDPKHVAQWWGPHGFTAPVCEVDARPGGEIYIVMRAPNGMDHAMNGVFQEVVPLERLVFTNGPIDEKKQPEIDGLTIVTFAEHEGGKTKLTLQTRGTAKVDYAARFLQGMEMGWNQSLGCLAEFLART